jgi:hypothetical protein
MVGIVVKNYEHFNRSLPNWDTPKGKYIRSRAHYEEECKKAGMISYERCSSICDEKQKAKDAPFSVSNETKELMVSVKSRAKKDGTVSLTGREVDYMKSKGMRFDRRLPEHYHTDKGGFE